MNLGMCFWGWEVRPPKGEDTVLGFFDSGGEFLA